MSRNSQDLLCLPFQFEKVQDHVQYYEDIVELDNNM